MGIAAEEAGGGVGFDVVVFIAAHRTLHSLDLNEAGEVEGVGAVEDDDVRTVRGDSLQTERTRLLYNNRGIVKW